MNRIIFLILISHLLFQSIETKILSNKAYSKEIYVLNHDDKSSFEQYVKAHSSTFAFFTQQQCETCQTANKQFQDLANSLSSESFMVVDIDRNPKTIANYSIKTVPALAYFKNGALQSVLVGQFDLEQMKQLLKC